MEKSRKTTSPKSSSHTISFRLQQEELEALEREAGRRGMRVGEYARSIVLGRDEVAKDLVEMDFSRVQSEGKVQGLELQIRALKEERDELVKIRKELALKISELAKELLETNHQQNHQQQEARAAQARFSARLKRAGDEIEKVWDLTQKGFLIVGTISVGVILSRFGFLCVDVVARSLISNPFTMILVLACLACALVLFRGIQKGLVEDAIFPAILVFFLTMVILGVIRAFFLSANPGPGYQVN